MRGAMPRIFRLKIVGNAVPSVPSAKRNIFAPQHEKMAENLPIEVKFSDGTLGTAFPTTWFIY